jgi:amidase
MLRPQGHRTNLSDMAMRINTVSSLHGLTRNPWHPNRTAGGGEAVAPTSGMSPIGLVNDIGGSDLCLKAAEAIEARLA